MFLESIQGLTTLKIYQADEARHAAMNAEAEGFRRATMNLLKMQLNSITVMDLFAFGGTAVGIVVVLFQLAGGAVSFAGAFTVVFLSAEFFIPLRTLGSFFHTAMNGMAAAEKMFAILDAPEPARGARTVNPADAGVTMRGVGYSYDGKRTVLAGVNFDAPRGSFIGIAGESGSGKSTLAGVLAGANANFTGSVEIGGVDVREVSAASLRDTVVTVAHDSYLFKGTVRSNLLMAKPSASDETLWDALRRARLDAFVRAAGGLDAPVAAAGANLSGGQRQRLAMARALLHDAPIYVLDEATSNIDAQSEDAICALVRELARDHTVIMVSHRLRAIAQADRIYVFENGRIVEAAAHVDLVQANGSYARMWAAQDVLEQRVERNADAEAEAGAGAKTPADTGAREAFADAKAAACAESAPAHAASVEQPASAPRPASASQPTSAPQPTNVPQPARPPKKRSAFSIMGRLVKLTRPLLPVMALAIALGVVGFLAAIFLTVFATFGLLDLAGAHVGLTSATVCVLVAVCGIVRGPLRYGEQLCNHYLAFRILALVRDRVFGALRRLAPAKLEGKDKGNLVSMATSDIELLEVFYAHTLSPAAIALATSLIMAAFIGAQSAMLGVLALAAYATVGIAMPAVAHAASGTGGRDVRDRIGDMNTFVLDSLRGLRETLQYGRAADRARPGRLDGRACRRRGAPQGKNRVFHGAHGSGGHGVRHGDARRVGAFGEHRRYWLWAGGACHRGAHVVVRAGHRGGEPRVNPAANACRRRARARRPRREASNRRGGRRA